MELNLKENIYWLAEYRGLKPTLNKKNGELVISQGTIEDYINVAQTTLSGLLEQGKDTRLTTLVRIAKGFGVDLWQLFAPPALLKASLDERFYQLIKDYAESSVSAQVTISDVAKAHAAQLSHE